MRGPETRIESGPGTAKAVGKFAPEAGRSTALYGTLMHGGSPLTRAQREMLAVVVSRANDCH